MDKRKREFVAQGVAPEDIRAGTYICVLHVIAERVPGCWCDVNSFQKLEARRYVGLPHEANDPLEVVGVCLPFVFVRHPSGDLRTLDIRRYRFASLEKAYARRAFNLLKAKAKARRNKSRCEDDDDDE